MPRRAPKRNPKQQLQFIQAPLDGASHPYGPKVRVARHPKIYLSEEQCQSSTAHSWVTPQFDRCMMSQTLRPHTRRGVKRSCSNGSDLDSSSLLRLPRHRKASVCKFPTLSFQKQATAPARPPVARGNGGKANLGGVREDNRTAGPDDRGPSSNRNAETRASVPSLGNETVGDACELCPAAAASLTGGANNPPDSTISTPAGEKQPPFTDGGFTPPDIETPDAVHASRTCSASRETRLSKLRLLFPSTPLQAPPPPVLVSDTPEEHYGRNWGRSQLSFL
ncbi:RAD9, HUS1, RAD1-interacting nuclear orphan protein 1 [Conger conger]|uniref:RAD9, HUS1, RAD1-interacting nuclear orphan protein 1 n=1 Tax=Conger conger TaxID=82655 RepID=UPI002A5ADBA4|nr:RAD9, HUS1, RAD1-interacting nuclear orphan protein 1 [Conger conger]XP_061085052.1 RAD9, HUS1, RAD1-interacting nuclear orphan protein 1 [Conger conger]XP_061085053.1 RAD9, HUS1, RAD1-interacting nuclear orphan protein 1 [Conger conger]XP_061085054.1 RAD9, HUS1, RAD1-interacting nuclear orphan protein 1 [Conger conger]